MSALEHGTAPVRRLPLKPAPLPKIAVVIPALNEEETVGAVVSAVPRMIPGVGAIDVIVVNDGSIDDTHARAIAAGADVVCAHSRPRGLVEAFKVGVHEALRRGASIVVNLDA